MAMIWIHARFWRRRRAARRVGAVMFLPPASSSCAPTARFLFQPACGHALPEALLGGRYPSSISPAHSLARDRRAAARYDAARWPAVRSRRRLPLRTTARCRLGQAGRWGRFRRRAAAL